MPRISEFFGIVISLYWAEHPPPHFHAPYGEAERRSTSPPSKSSAAVSRTEPGASNVNGGALSELGRDVGAGTCPRAAGYHLSRCRDRFDPP